MEKSITYKQSSRRCEAYYYADDTNEMLEETLQITTAAEEEIPWRVMNV